ncbi:hypothetical protein TCE0_047f17678 [Talaromyces pinophilus]|uniref:Major facilitator superfamily (MFS) profile domain-containing protein n=1 Tax=Talaromyces pinophilus TaxID=128442 RepID=A0A0B8N4R3_TALPI|nr:hypothetical protein TCE0_047f17678 [Talaromyces pinophilus]
MVTATVASAFTFSLSRTPPPSFPVLLADYFGGLNTLVPFSILATILAFVWVGIRDVAGAVVFARFYGYASGVIVSLPPSILTHMSPNMGIRLGMMFVFAGYSF